MSERGVPRDPLGDDWVYSTPTEITKVDNEVTLDSLPTKSRKNYEIQFDLFQEWCKTKGVKRLSENVLLAYMSDLAKKYKSSTLWSKYSMIKATLKYKSGVDITKFGKVTLFLKKQSIGQRPKKSRIFDREQVNKFLNEAPDSTYLMMKVALVIGISGACRSWELTSMKIDDICDKEDVLIIQVPQTKTNIQRSFLIRSSKSEEAPDYVAICKKYINLRPRNAETLRLFMKYVNGKCHLQNVGHHTIGAIPSKIAQYLGLDNPKDFTGHCFRRTSARLHADSGGDLLTLKRYGGWRSSAVAQSYVEDALRNDSDVSQRILVKNENFDDISEAFQLPSDDESQNSSIDCPALPFVENVTTSEIIRPNLSSQGISFVNCTINNPVFYMGQCPKEK